MTSWPKTALDSQSSLTLLITSSQNVLDVESEIFLKIIRAKDKHITKMKVIWKNRLLAFGLYKPAQPT